MESKMKTTVFVEVLLLVVLVNLPAYADYTVDEYWAEPPTVSCDYMVEGCDPTYTKLTDGTSAIDGDQYAYGYHAIWEVDTGSTISIYFDLGSVKEVGTVTIDYLSWYSPIDGDLTVLVTEDSDPNTTNWTTVNYNDEWAPRVQWTNPELELGVFQDARIVRLDFVCIEPGYDISYLMLSEVDFGEPDAIIFNTHPEDVIADSGEAVTLTVDAQTGSSYTLSYEWLKDGDALTNGGNISGADTDTLHITDVNVNDAGDYTCLVSSSAYPSGVESEAGSVMVVSSTDYGNRVMAHSPLLYWNFDGTAGTAVDLVSRSTERTISAENPARVAHSDFGNAIEVTEGDDTTVWRSGSLGAGSYGGPFAVELMIRKHTVQTNPPAEGHNAYIMETGGNNSPSIIDGFAFGGELNEITFFNASTSSGTAGHAIVDDLNWHHLVFVDYDDNKIDMYVDGVKVPDFDYDPASPDNGVYLDLNGPTALGGSMYWGGAYWGYDIDEVAFYDLSNLTEAEIGDRGQAIALHSDMDGPAYITEDPLDTIAPPDTNAVLTVSAAGAEPLSYQWKKDGVDLTDGGKISGATTPILTIANVQPGADNGQYSCSVSNAEGSDVSAAGTLSVQCYYEISGDINADCVVDMFDLAELAAHWLERSDVQ